MSDFFLHIPELDLLECLIWGEARGESLDGRSAVAWVVRNRLVDPRWPNTWQSVILQPKQFSCFNPGDPNLDKMVVRYRLRRVDMVWKSCRLIAFGVMHDWIPDNSRGANHYCHVDIVPRWAEGVEPIIRIGYHKFYRL